MGLALIGGGCFALPYQHALNTLEPLTAVYGVFIWDGPAKSSSSFN